MGYRQLVISKLRQAFDIAGDLVLDVTLIQANATTFDFSTLAANKTTVPSTVVKALLIEKSREDSVSNTLSGKLMFITEDTSDLSKYDRVLINNQEWKIVEPVKDDGYTVTVSITRSLNG